MPRATWVLSCERPAWGKPRLVGDAPERYSNEEHRETQRQPRKTRETSGAPELTMDMRYTVQHVSGMGMGAGMYQVVDVYQGRNVGEPVFWKEEAEKTARRLNHEEYCATRDDDRVSKSESCDDQTLHETLHETENATQKAITTASEPPVLAETPADIAAAAQRLGLKPVRAWVPDNPAKPRSSSAERTRRSREKAEQQGHKQLSVSLPIDLHERIKALAARIRAGEPEAQVWADLSPEQKPIPDPASPLPVPAKLRGWRWWLLRWLLPSDLRILIE